MLFLCLLPWVQAASMHWADAHMAGVKLVLAGGLGTGQQLAALAALQRSLNSEEVLLGMGGFGFGCGLHPPKSWHCVQGGCARLAGDMETAREVWFVLGPS